MIANRSGFRGYIASRPVRGTLTPQHVQNLVIRDYAARNKMSYLLSATEMSVPGCFLVMEDVLAELPSIDGMICYSLFMLPHDDTARHRVYERVLGTGGELHAALESLKIANENDVQRIEDIWTIERLLPDCLPPNVLA
jgi:sporadic carbohydrate cluster protein (TIGR04323 family)